VRRIETIEPVSVAFPGPGTAVVDFGQNLNGWVRLTDLGPRNTHLTLTHGEVVDGTGLVSTENLRAFLFATGDLLPAGQVDEVISSGRAGEVFEPRHTTHGFRYVQVDGCAGEVDPASIHAVVVHSDLVRTGSFVCSNDDLNALHEAGVWSFRGNACEIPTDCPQRERSGFTGDWQVFVPTAALVYDVQAFSEKWLANLAADQWADGRVPTVTPNPAGDGPSGVHFEDLAAGSAGWGDAAVIVPWELWRAYGNLANLRDRLPSMRAWVDDAAGTAAGQRHPARVEERPDAAPSERFLWDTGFHFGEWLEPGVRPRPDPSADHGIVATAFLHRSAELVARAAALLAEPAIEATYRGIADGARDAWRREFLAADGRLTIESQANYARGLAFGLIPPALRSAAAGCLAELVAETAGHLGTGFLSTGQLLPALADHGQAEQAYALLQSRGVPSWLGMLDAGATTVWEWWDGVDDGAVRGSLNHYSKAAVLSFLYTHVTGIRLAELNPPFQVPQSRPEPRHQVPASTLRTAWDTSRSSPYQRSPETSQAR
jgi:alpha-L-rhamnosidase